VCGLTCVCADVYVCVCGWVCVCLGKPWALYVCLRTVRMCVIHFILGVFDADARVVSPLT
jgi:hypothetical protein